MGVGLFSVVMVALLHGAPRLTVGRVLNGTWGGLWEGGVPSSTRSMGALRIYHISIPQKTLHITFLVWS